MSLEKYLIASVKSMLAARGWKRRASQVSVGQRHTQFTRPAGELEVIFWLKTTQMNWPGDQSVVFSVGFGLGSEAHTAVVEEWEERRPGKALFYALTVPPETRRLWPPSPIRERCRGSEEIRCAREADCDAVCQWLGHLESGSLLPWAGPLSTYRAAAAFSVHEGHRVPPEAATWMGDARQNGLTSRILNFESSAVTLYLAGGHREEAIELARRVFQRAASAPDSFNPSDSARLLELAERGPAGPTG